MTCGFIDSGLTGRVAERRTLERCSTVKIVTVAGNVFLLPNEVPDQIAAVINEALAAVDTRRVPARDAAERANATSAGTRTCLSELATVV